MGMENHPHEARTTRNYHEPQEDTENHENLWTGYHHQKEKPLQEYYEERLGTPNSFKCTES